MNTGELLEVVDIHGRTMDIAPRSVIHGNPQLMHKVVHVLVFNDKGELLLQKRALSKDVAPGKWDTSVGGHVAPGEDLLAAARREMEEEIGVLSENIKFLYSYLHSNPYETELVHSYKCIHNGPFSFDQEEIDDIKFWLVKDIHLHMDSEVLSDNFQSEFRRYLSFQDFNLISKARVPY